MKLLLSTLLLSATANAGLIEPKALWAKPAVNVCWFDRDGQIASRVDIRTDSLVEFLNEEQKKHIQQVIEETYTPEKTGIHFVGWKNCSDGDSLAQADVVVVANTNGFGPSHLSTWGQSDIGLGIYAATNKEDGTFGSEFYDRLDEESILSTKRVIQFAFHHIDPAYSALKRISERGVRKAERVLLQQMEAEQNSTFVDTTAIHEFGHMAGFRHEHERKDCDPSKHSAWKFKNDSFNQMESGVTYKTPYDHLSIMNYNHDGVVKSLYGAKFLCATSPEGYLIKLSKEECARIQQVIPRLRELSPFDTFVLQKAYLGNSSVSDFDAETRAFIDSIVLKVKKSRLAPDSIYDQPSQSNPINRI